MKILLLGATGRTGRYILEYALAQGNQVNCLVRNSQKIQQHKKLEVFVGNPSHPIDLEKAIQGCEAVISLLNISRKTDFPWSKLRTPKHFLSKVMTNLIFVAARNDINRVLICSAWGVAETRKDIPFWFRWTIDFSNIKYAYLDHERQEEILTNSNCSWTIVRPTGLLNSRKCKDVIESYGNIPRPRLTIGRKSVAKYMLAVLEDERLIGKNVVISN